MMRLAALLAALARPAACDLDYSRLHIVDVFHPMHDGPVNLLVRSNQPNNASGFDIEALQRDIATAVLNDKERCLKVSDGAMRPRQRFRVARSCTMVSMIFCVVSTLENYYKSKFGLS